MKKAIVTLIAGLMIAAGVFAQESKSKTLIVYFSATGTTERVAKSIARLTGGDLYSLEPEKAYTSADLDWTDKNCRVGKERSIANFATPLKNAVVQNWNDYDTVYIGTPIWMGNASWAINEFLMKNNFASKRVIPFCTSASSPYANVGDKMQKLAAGGNWIEGIRFGARATESEIKAFVKRVQDSAK